jgi:class 3 adenylate cyclase
VASVSSSLLGALLALAVAGFAVLTFSLVRSRRRLRRLTERLERAASDLQSLQLAFSRFAPDEVIERVIARGVSRIGEKKEVTVLFADLVGFTALSERVEPAVLVEILNGYFERMSQAISEHRGHVSTFIGDGILAFFGALAPNPWQANDAVHAALAMQAAMVSYNRELLREGVPAVSVGIGLHRGSGVAGLVGSGDLMQFAFVGRTVNVAARVQDLTRQYGCDILVTEGLARSLDPRFSLRGLPPTAVKGIAQPVSVYSVEGFDAEGREALPRAPDRG